MNINERINAKSNYINTVNRITIIPNNRYELKCFLKYNLHFSPNFKCI